MNNINEMIYFIRQQDCLSFEGGPHTNVYIWLRSYDLCCSCDLDLDPMNFMYTNLT